MRKLKSIANIPKTYRPNRAGIVDNSPLDLDVNSIISHIGEVASIVGSKWILKKMKEEEKRRKQGTKNVRNRKHSYLYKTKPHPLVEWALESERWRKACLQSNRLELTESILKLSILGKALANARHQKGFDKLVGRLRQKAQFHSAAFEVEVASSYVERGWSVEFVEEGKNRTPDLKVTKQDESAFWVECKCRDKLTGRDKKISEFWSELEASLLRILGPKKANVSIVVSSSSDPVRSELDSLRQFILQLVENAKDVGSSISGNNPTNDSLGKYQVVVKKLSEPNVSIEADGIRFESNKSFDRVCMTAEMKTDSDNKKFVKNPIILCFRSAIATDKVTGIINGFKSAVGQLPVQGPGVIWIRIPDNVWNDDLEKSFAQAESLIRKELSGSHNTRVNAVILMTRIFQKLSRDGQTGLGYKPLKKIIEHKNPRHNFATTSPASNYPEAGPLSRLSLIRVLLGCVAIMVVYLLVRLMFQSG